MTLLLSKASRGGAGPAGRRRSRLRRFAYAIVAVGLAAMAVALGAAVAPRLAGIEGLAITSGSMGAAAPTGSLVYTRDRPASAVRPGDVIVMERPGHPIVVHRVLSVEAAEGALLARTKGDVNVAADPDPYPLPDRVPVMVRSVPLIGYLVMLLERPLGWLLLVVLPAAAVAASVLRDLWRKESGPAASEQQAAQAERQVPPAERQAAPAETEVSAEASSPPALTAESDDVPEERLAELARWIAPSRDNVITLSARAAGPEEEAGAATLPAPRIAAPEPTSAPEPAPEPAPPYLLYVSAGTGYHLVERAGELPGAGARIELDGRVLSVLRVGASPLPGDRRRCVFVLGATESHGSRRGAVHLHELPRAVEQPQREARSG